MQTTPLKKVLPSEPCQVKSSIRQFIPCKMQSTHGIIVDRRYVKPREKIVESDSVAAYVCADHALKFVKEHTRFVLVQ